MDSHQDSVAYYLQTILVIRLAPLSPDGVEILRALVAVRGVFVSADGFARSLASVTGISWRTRSDGTASVVCGPSPAGSGHAMVDGS
jgi:hypothetical protein